MPNKITSKHNFRYVPRMNGLDIVKKLRAQIDKNGYKDVEMKLIGDVPWSRGSKNRDNDMTLAQREARKTLVSVGLTGTRPAAPTTSASADLLRGRNGLYSEASGGYWPSYLWTDGEVGEKVGTVFLPMGEEAVGDGGGAVRTQRTSTTPSSIRPRRAASRTTRRASQRPSGISRTKRRRHRNNRHEGAS